MIGYENRDVSRWLLLRISLDFRNDAVDAGKIGAGHSATVQLRWEDPDTHQVTEINGNFNTWDLAESFEQAAPRYQLAVVVAQYAEILRNSPWAAGTYPSSLVDHAYRLSSFLWYNAEVVEFASRASQIRALGQ